MKKKFTIINFQDNLIVLGIKSKKHKTRLGSIHFSEDHEQVKEIHIRKQGSELSVREKLELIKKWIKNQDIQITSETTIKVRISREKLLSQLEYNHEYVDG